MITIVCNSKFNSLMTALGARIIEGHWVINQLSHDHKEILEAEGALVEGCKYSCWDTWFPNIYWVTRDSRCSVSFNTLTRRVAQTSATKLDELVIGRAKPPKPARRKGSGCGYRVCYQDQVFPSETALARYFGVDPVKFRSRRQLGWSIEEALK
jgi:hypothetical protein